MKYIDIAELKSPIKQMEYRCGPWEALLISLNLKWIFWTSVMLQNYYWLWQADNTCTDRFDVSSAYI